MPWRSLLAEALLGLGARDEARRLVAEELELARPSAPRARSASPSARWPLEGGDDVPLLREAAAALDASEAQLERARAHADLGVALRRAGEATRRASSCALAVDVAHRCGASALEDRALGELRAAGARPSRRATTAPTR